MLESKIFANSSTPLSKPVREALGVHVFKIPSEKAHADDPALRKALDAAEEIMDENRSLLRKLK